MEDSLMRTLYIGNLETSVAEGLLIKCFGKLGQIQNCRIIREPGKRACYAFVKYSSIEAATTALTAMNKQKLLGKEIKVNWAKSPSNQPKAENDYCVYIRNFGPEIETEVLREAFAAFGQISYCSIVRENDTGISKRYAFVSFVNKEEAENAIKSMNGMYIGSRPIHVVWSKKNLTPSGEVSKPGTRCQEIYNHSSPMNTTVYCGGYWPNVISGELMYEHFIRFGQIQSVCVLKGYAFIKFASKESAARAIYHMHNSEINGNSVKCFWAKENVGYYSTNNMNRTTSMGAAVAAVNAGSAAGVSAFPIHIMAQQQIAAAAGTTLTEQMITPQQITSTDVTQYPNEVAGYQYMGYWYLPTGFPVTQVQIQYMQPCYYPYSHTGAQQTGIAVYGFVQPYVIMGVPGTVGPGGSAVVTTAADAENYSFTPQMIYSAPMPQYQAQ